MNKQLVETKKVLRQIIVITFLGCLVGLAFNALRGEGLQFIAEAPPRLHIPDPLGRDIYSHYQIHLDKAMEAWHKGKGIFLDSREEANYEMAHIPMARNIPYDEFDEHRDKLLSFLSGDLTIIVYCEGTDCDSGILLVKELLDTFKEKYNMYGRVKLFYDGWNQWLKAELPTEAGEDLSSEEGD